MELTKAALQVYFADEKNKRTMDIITELLKGGSAIELAVKYNVSRQAVYDIRMKYIDTDITEKSAVSTAKLTLNEFIERSHAVHGSRYSYDNAVYINNRVMILITCPVHGDFSQPPKNHLVGNGCPLCMSQNNRNKKLSK